MARANLEGLKDREEIALAWSKFLIDDLVERREARVRAITASIYIFREEDVPLLPTLPEFFSPEDPASAKEALKRYPEAYAYLAVLPGLPLPKAEWVGDDHQKAAQRILGIPPEIIDRGEYPWYLMAVFVAPNQRMTFCGAFDGEKFRTIRPIYGSYGGYLTDLLGFDS